MKSHFLVRVVLEPLSEQLERGSEVPLVIRAVPEPALREQVAALEPGADGVVGPSLRFLDGVLARGAVRFSVGYPTTIAEVDQAAALLLERLGQRRV